MTQSVSDDPELPAVTVCLRERSPQICSDLLVFVHCCV